jgi:COMPASS component SPP1
LQDVRCQSFYDVSAFDVILYPALHCNGCLKNCSPCLRCCDRCEEWYHGDCVNVTERDAKYIKRYYCKKCRIKDPKISIVYKPKQKEESRSSSHHTSSSKSKPSDNKDKEERRKERRRREERKAKKKEQRDRERRKEREEEAKKSKRDDAPSPSRNPSVDSTHAADSPKAVTKSRSVLNEINLSADEQSDYRPGKQKVSSDESEDAWEPPAIAATSKPSKSKDSKATGPKKSSASKPSKGNVSSKSAAAAAKAGAKRKRRLSSSDSDVDLISYWDPASQLSGSRQCFGHKCTKEARDASKYCSENCGINLASLRIVQTLPDRIREWNLSQCEAIRARQEAVKARLEQLNWDFRSLEETISEGKSKTVEEKRDSDDDDDSSAVEMTVHCVTCGADVQTRTAIRHMERCYNKMESQTSFASRFKTQIEDERMFCDFYNPKEGTYCKRLQVLCPEHNPDEKRVPKDDEVCGYPLQKEIFGQTTEFCRVAKRACQAHYCWEKLRRAELDMERVKQWMKVDELLEQERQVRGAMSNRAGVLGLLLHSTFNHEQDGRMRNSQQQQQVRPSRPVVQGNK